MSTAFAGLGAAKTPSAPKPESKWPKPGAGDNNKKPTTGASAPAAAPAASSGGPALTWKQKEEAKKKAAAEAAAAASGAPKIAEIPSAAAPAPAAPEPAVADSAEVRCIAADVPHSKFFGLHSLHKPSSPRRDYLGASAVRVASASLISLPVVLFSEMLASHISLRPCDAPLFIALMSSLPTSSWL